MYQQLYKDKDEKFNKMYLQLAAEKERIGMAKDKLERAVLVLQEEYKKRILRESRLKKYVKRLRNQNPQNASNVENIDDEDDETEESPEALLSNIDMETFSDSNLGNDEIWL
jgi:hypothetical protein